MATARPKSPIWARPSAVSQTLPGLRSRQTVVGRLLDQVSDIAARQERQDHVGLSRRGWKASATVFRRLLADVEDGDDVRVVAEAAHRLGFARDPGPAGG